MDKLLESFDVVRLNGLLNKAKHYKEQADIANATYKDMQEHKDGRGYAVYLYKRNEDTGGAG